jgi:hypothetical protein
MKQPAKILFACIVAVVVGGIAASPTNGQQPAPPSQESLDIARLVGEIEQQQTQMIANQDAIEKRMAAIAEDLRLAKAMAARAK